MDPRTKHESRTQGPSVVSRDAEVAQLRKELQLCNMRLSQMRTRLIATLDEFDASRAVHQREFKLERRAKEKLSEKLDRYIDEVRRAEGERDEMREVVSILVEKVEKCNDYSAWPCSRIDLTRPLEFLPPLRRHNEQMNQDRDAIRTSMYEMVHRQLEEERRDHARTKKEADAEISRLRAMVARRDAELEACTTHSGHRALLSSSHLPERTTGGYDEAPNTRSTRPQTTDGHTRVISQTLARQRTLEHEIAILQQQLDDAQAVSRAVSSKVQVMEDTAPAGGAGDQTNTLSKDARLPPRPQIHPHSFAVSPSPYNLGARLQSAPSNPRVNSEPLQPQRSVPVAEAPRDRGTNLIDLAGLEHDINRLSAVVAEFRSERYASKAMVREATMQGKSSTVPPQSDFAACVSHHFEECAREQQALRQRLEEVIQERTNRERALQSEVDTLRQTLSETRAATIATCAKEDGNVHRDLNIAATRAASRPTSPAPTDPIPDIRLLHSPLFDDTPNKEVQETDTQSTGSHGDGSELEEQSMELATPLHQTILSLADDDLLIPSLPSTTQMNFSVMVEPTEVPLPVSPDSADDEIVMPRLVGSPPLLLPPPPAYLPLAQGKSIALAPPVYVEPSRVSSDLIARVESISRARVDAIEREFEEKTRELERRTRELAEKEVALEELRKTTSRVHTQIAFDDGTQGPNLGAGHDAHAHANANKPQESERQLALNRNAETLEQERDEGARGDPAAPTPPEFR